MGRLKVSSGQVGVNLQSLLELLRGIGKVSLFSKLLSGPGLKRLLESIDMLLVE